MAQNNLERKSVGKRGLSNGVKLLIIILNSYVLYAVIGTQVFLNITIVGLVLFLLFLLVKFMQQRGKVKGNVSPWLMKSYAKITRKYIAASALGLFFAVLVFSQATILPYSLERDVIADELEQLNSPVLNVDYNPNRDMNYSEMKTALETDKEIVYARIAKIITEAKLPTSYEIRSSISMGAQLQFPTENELNPYGNIIYPSFNALDEEGWKQYESVVGVEIEDTANYIGLVKTESFDRYGDANFVKAGNASVAVDVFNNMTIPIFINATNTVDDGRITEIVGSPYYNDVTVFMSESLFDKLVVEFSSMAGYTPVRIRDTVSYDPQIFADVDIFEFGDKLEGLQQKLYEEQIVTENFFVSMDSPLFYRINELLSTVYAIRSLILFVSIPLIIMAIMLVYFSMNLVRKRKEALISIMKIRGTGEPQLSSMMAFEMVVATVISIIAGMGASVPFIYLSQFVSPLLDLPIEIISVQIPPTWYWQLPLLGFLVSFDLNIGNIISLTKLSIEEGEDVIEKKAPFWQRYNIDVILLILGLFQFVVTEILGLVELNFVLIGILFAVLPFSIVGFILGSTLFVERMFPGFAGRLSDILWRRRGDLTALSTRNLRKTRFSAARLSSIFVFGIMISSLFIILPGTLNANTKLQISHQIGAEGLVTFSGNESAAINNLTSFEEVEDYSVVHKLFASGFDYSLNIIAVDPTNITSVIEWERVYASMSLEDVVGHLSRNETLVDNRLIEDGNAAVGKNFSFVDDQNQVANFKTMVGGGITAFPLFETESSFFSSYFIVMSRSEFLANFVNSSSVNKAIAFSIVDDTDLDVFKEDLSQSFTNNAILELEIKRAIENPVSRLISLLAQSLVLISILSTVVAVIFYSFITLTERKKEIGIFRALGMVRSQIFKMLLLESIFIILFSMVFGVLLGFTLSRTIVKLIQLSQLTFSNLPVVFAVNSLYYIYLGFVGALSVVSAYFPARITASKQTSDILRAD